MLVILADTFRTATRLEPRSTTPPPPEWRIWNRRPVTAEITPTDAR